MKITNYKLKTIKGLLFVWLFLLLAPAGQAKVVIVNSNDGSVINNVSVQANSGGQTTVNGEVITTGTSNAKVKVYTEIDGEVVQDIEETATGANAQIQVKSRIKADDGQAEVKTEINNQGEQSENNEVIDLDVANKAEDDDGQVTEAEGLTADDAAVENFSSNTVQLFTSFWQSFAQFLKNIFSIFK